MHLKKTYATAGEAKRASKPKQKIRAGWQRNPAKIKEAFERPDKNGEPMIELLLDLPLPDGGEFERRDWLSNEWAPEKLRNCCIACGLLDHYEQQDIPAELFLGKAVMVKLGFSGKFLNIEDYRAVPALANLRNVAKALLLLGGVSLAALTGACANVEPYPRGQSSYYAEPPRYQYFEQRFVDPPAQNYAATVPQSAPVAPSSFWGHDLGTMANGAAIGAAGGMIAGVGDHCRHHQGAGDRRRRHLRRLDHRRQVKTVGAHRCTLKLGIKDPPNQTIPDSPFNLT